MGKRRTFGQYRRIDLALFALLVAVCEYVIVHAANWWFPQQPFMVSLAAPLTAIVYMRWGWWGAIHAVEAGAVYCLFSGATGEQYIIYCVGNLLSLPAVFLLKKAGKEKMRARLCGLGFAALVLFLMQAGRALTALALCAAPAVLPRFFTTDSLSYIFTLVIIWIAQKLDGIYEDQKHYLLRTQSQEEEKGGQL